MSKMLVELYDHMINSIENRDWEFDDGEVHFNDPEEQSICISELLEVFKGDIENSKQMTLERMNSKKIRLGE